MSLWTTPAGPLPEDVRRAFVEAAEHLSARSPEELAKIAAKLENDPAFRKQLEPFLRRRRPPPNLYRVFR